MSPLFETIKCEEGVLYNLSWHTARLLKARKEYFGLTGEIHLEELIKIPQDCMKGLFRCRVTYSPEIKTIEFLPHQFREIKRLKLLEDNMIHYPFKFTDRNALQKLFEKRGFCDDILIVKNGCITDSFTANPVFFDGHQWWTPDTPLLPGTQRARLLEEAKISECRITPGDLSKYKMAGLINAMQDLEHMPVISIKDIQK
jgi:4-amino-4-deoxychorismate lyase